MKMSLQNVGNFVQAECNKNVVSLLMHIYVTQSQWVKNQLAEVLTCPSQPTEAVVVHN